MYVQRFGLASEPFSIAPDPRFLFMSERHREALAHLLYGLQGGGGFVLLTGEIGAGKTTVCRCFLERVPASCNVAYIFNPRLTDTELLKTICDEFHLALPEPAGAPTVKHYLDPLNAFLLQAHAQGRNNVLIIDEAQNLSATLLEQLRLLTNLETAERKLLQIILIGQPELREMLARPELEPLAQRVIARYHLQALTADEGEAYIRHRLGVAGLHGELPFEPAALRRIHALARGVPRRINLLCDRALLGAYAGGHARVDRRIVAQAAREVFDDGAASAQRLPRERLLLAGAAGVLLGALGLAAAAGWWRAPGATAVAGAAAAASAAASAPAGRPFAAASAGAAASVPATAAARPAPTPIDLAALLPLLSREEAPAWRELAALWPEGAALTAPPCSAGQPLRCHRATLTLAQIRQLARPGLLPLRDDGGRPAYALLLGLGERDALLQVDGRPRTLPLAALAQRWQGEFATLWRAPDGLPDGGSPERRDLPAAQQQALADWLGAQLRKLSADSAENERPLRQRIAAFQLAQGLKPDGLAGPMTLMQLNRAAGIDEPRLRQEN
ncbi:AAA family ATPase [Aquabacterium sp.]|uniref:ExeA family protein n=1 Tax=Aquabacterium sp. TaxID=1872578 RepID=UPI003784BAF0